MISKRSLFCFPLKLIHNVKSIPVKALSPRVPAVCKGPAHLSKCKAYDHLLAASGEGCLRLESYFLSMACKVLHHVCASRTQPSLVCWGTTSFSISPGAAEAAWWPLQLFHDPYSQSKHTWVRSAFLVHKCWRLVLLLWQLRKAT